MKNTPRIVAYFQRHGSTTLNDGNRFRGPIDAPLDENGIADAHAAADFFKGIDLGDAWSSDKDRTQTTARAILQPKGMVYQSDPHLEAWNIGYLAGEKKDENQHAIEYFQTFPDEVVPNGESLNQFKQRVRQPILRAIQSGIKTGKPSLTVTHSSVIHEVNSIIHNDHSANLVKPGGVIGVEFDGNKFNVKPLLKPDDGDHYAT